jgi:hypothetical protein
MHDEKSLWLKFVKGGGGTFGVVVESTTLASPRIDLQTFILTFNPTTNITRKMWSIMVENGLKWGGEGWGGFSQANAVVLVNPKMSSTEAEASLAPLMDFGKQLQATNGTNTTLIFTEFPSWNSFFEGFASQFVVVSL